MAATRRHSRQGSNKTQRRHTKKFDMKYGSPAQVMHGTAEMTSGGVTKAGWMYNKHGRIVSRARHALAKKQKHLEKAGYSAKKGKFGYIRIKSSKHTRRHRKGKKGTRKHRK